MNMKRHNVVGTLALGWAITGAFAVTCMSIQVTPAFAQTSSASRFGRTISSIEVRGNRRVEQSAVLLQVGSEIGKRLDADTVEKDIKNIYRTGYFDNVSAQTIDAGNSVELVFDVAERPAIREVKIEGNDDVSKKEIEEKLNLTGKKFLDRRKINSGVEEVRRYYQTEGFYGTKIDVGVKEAGDNQVDVTFDITEGEKRVIRELVFEGNSQVDEDKLKSQLATSRYKWWASWLTGSGVVKEEDLEKDVALLSRYYLSNGFVDVKVAKPEVVEVEDGLNLVYRITEGDIYRFGTVSAQGDLIEDSKEKTLEGVKSIAGETFSVEKLRDDSFAVSEKFTNIGYAFVNVDPATKIDRQQKIVDVSYVVNKGELVHVNRVLIQGNKKTRDNVIRRSLTFTERELFSSSKIKRSQELLQRLGYFDEVTITPSPSSKPNEVDLNVAVREGNTGTFSAGAGVSSGDGFIVSSRISENNLFGSGNSLSLDVNSGSSRENYVLAFNNPRVNDSRWSFGMEGLVTEREFDDFDRKQHGGSVSVGYPLWFLGPEYLDDVNFGLEYELLNIDISNVELDAPTLVKDSEGKSTSSSVTPRLVRNTIDNPLDPTKGSRQVLRFETAGLGGDERFWLGQASNAWYYPLWASSFGNFVFSHRVNFGWGETFNDEPFPLFRRFFPGGINSVRGYEARELGPKDKEGNEYGGNKQLVTNFEMIFPLIDSLGLNGVTFYDLGQAFDDEESIEVGELRAAFGWGIRWRSPIAPIRVEVGYPIDREPGEKSVVTNFSFGAPL